MAQSTVGRLLSGDGLPASEDLPRYVAPLPDALETRFFGDGLDLAEYV